MGDLHEEVSLGGLARLSSDAVAQSASGTIEAATNSAQAVVAASPYWWVTPLVILISTAAAWIGTSRTIKHNRSIAKTRATIDLIERSESQVYYQELADVFREVRQDPKGFELLENPSNDTLKKQRFKALAFLNHYELIALGCKVQVLDKDFYRRWMKSTLVRDWVSAEKFIYKLRDPFPGDPESPRHPELFLNLENLAREWGAPKQLELFKNQGAASSSSRESAPD